MSRLNIASIATALCVCLIYALAWLDQVPNPHPSVGMAWTAIAAYWTWLQGRAELEPPVRRRPKRVHDHVWQGDE